MLFDFLLAPLTTLLASALIAAAGYRVLQSHLLRSHLLLSRVPLPTSSDGLAAGLGLGFLFALPALCALLWLSPLRVATTSQLLLGSIASALILTWVFSNQSKSPADDPKLKPAEDLPLSGVSKLAYGLIAGLTGAQIAISIAANITLPIFPWDGFTTWIYRAKAWSLAESIAPIQNVNEWLSAGGTGYSITASNYPSLVSMTAAFFGSITGQWRESGVSVAWTCSLCAATAVLHYRLRLLGVGKLAAIFGAYLLISTPLVAIHSAVAGYADLWLLAYSGIGLSLLLWQPSDSSWKGTTTAFFLLAVGTQIKFEGWIWLAAGIAICVINLLQRRFGSLRLLLGASAILIILCACYFFGVTAINLGPLGIWGIKDQALSLGVIGSHSITPRNQLPIYIEGFTHDLTFALLGLVYLIAVFAIAVRRPQGATRFLTMAIILGTSQGVIFGLTDYGRFAESGTAVYRVLMPMVPVFIVTILFAHKYTAESVANRLRPIAGLNLSLGTTLGTLLTALLVVCVLLWNEKSGQSLPLKEGSELTIPVGTVKQTQGKIEFLSSSQQFGVASYPLQTPLNNPADLVFIDVTTKTPSEIFLYWIGAGAGTGNFNSTKLQTSGLSLVNLGSTPSWKNEGISEFGLVIADSGFPTTRIHSLSVNDRFSLLGLRALISMWWQPETLSLADLNVLSDAGDSLLSLTRVALITLFIIVLIAFFSGTRIGWGKCLAIRTLAFGTLWILIHLVVLNRLVSFVDTSRTDASTASFTEVDLQQGGPKLIKSIEDNSTKGQPVAIVMSDKRLKYQATRLPYLMLPQPATVVSKRQLKDHADWNGLVVVIGATKSETDRLRRKISRLVPSAPVQGLAFSDAIGSD